MVQDDVALVDFQPRHRDDWRRLNEAWLIAGGFAVEPRDRAVLDDPRGAILDRGGRILIAERAGRGVGCVALLPMDDGGYEVAKMTVEAEARGLGLGRRLMQACIDAARAANAPRLYLETNASLTAAIALYRASGFIDLPSQPTDYARCNVWMERRL